MNAPKFRSPPLARLPLQPRTQPGRCLGAALERTAFRLEISPNACVKQLGLPSAISKKLTTLAALMLDTNACRLLAESLGLSPATVTDSSQAYFGHLTRTRTQQAELEQQRLERIAATLELTDSYRTICPQCLASGRLPRLAWQSIWLFACTRHRALLVRSCPTCGEPIASHRSSARVTDPNTCGNRSSPDLPCPQRLSLIESQSLHSFPALIAVQDTLESILRGREHTVGGRALLPFEALRTLRELASVLGEIAAPHPAGSLPLSLNSAALSFARGKRTRLAIPQETASLAFAALLPTVFEIAHEPNDQAIEDRLFELIRSAHGADIEQARRLIAWLTRRLNAPRTPYFNVVFHDLRHRLRHEYRLYPA